MIKFITLDKRYAGFPTFKYAMTTKDVYVFNTIRNWCSLTFGEAIEIEDLWKYTDFTNPAINSSVPPIEYSIWKPSDKWSWDINRLSRPTKYRIFIKDEDCLMMSTLRWGC